MTGGESSQRGKQLAVLFLPYHVRTWHEADQAVALINVCC